jgi:hypothetical protein
MFGPIAYIIFGLIFLLSVIARVLASHHIGPKWIERFVLGNLRSTIF